MNAPNHPRTLRLFLADDHPVLREGIKALVDAQPDMEVIGEAGDGETAWQRACELRPDLVIMDVSLPRLSGAQATARIKQQCPQVRVLVLSVHDEAVYLRELMEAGASGYVLKRVVAEELIRAVRAVAAGGLYVDPQFMGLLVSGILRGSKEPFRGEVAGEELSERETEVARLVARGYSNKEIGTQLVISTKTVDTYRARAMEKLGLRSRADLVGYALERHWLQTPG